MKKLLLLPAVLLMTALPLLAQVKVGVKAGLNASTTKFDNHRSYGRSKYSLRYQAGLFTTIPVGENAFIQPELFYARKAWRVDYIHSNEVYINFLDYLNLPLLMGYRYSGKTFIFSGPEFGYLLWAWEPEYRPWIIYKRFEAGITAGIMHQFTQNLRADIRYSLGLTDIVEWNSDVPPHHYIGGLNRAFQVSASYIFGKKSTI